MNIIGYLLVIFICFAEASAGAYDSKSKNTYCHHRKTTWDDAKLICEGRNQSMITPMTAEDIQLVQYTCGWDKDYWTAGKRNPKNPNSLFLYPNKQEIPKDLWSSGEPNNAGGKEVCTNINKQGKMNDRPCNHTEYYPTHPVCQNKGCVDDHIYCPAWAKQGDCDTNSGYMKGKCKKSCGICKVKTCVDDNDQCESWAARHECDINPDYMLVYCKKSCGVC